MGDHTFAINAKANSYMKDFSMLWKTGHYTSTCGLAGYQTMRMNVIVFSYLHLTFAQMGPNFKFGTH